MLLRGLSGVEGVGSTSSCRRGIIVDMRRNKERGLVKEGAQRSHYRRWTGSRPEVGYRSAVEGPWDGWVVIEPEAACQLMQQCSSAATARGCSVTSGRGQGWRRG